VIPAASTAAAAMMTVLVVSIGRFIGSRQYPAPVTDRPVRNRCARRAFVQKLLHTLTEDPL